MSQQLNVINNLHCTWKKPKPCCWAVSLKNFISILTKADPAKSVMVLLLDKKLDSLPVSPSMKL